MGWIAWPTMLACGALVMALGPTPAQAQSFAEIDAAVQDGIQKVIQGHTDFPQVRAVCIK